MSKSATTNIDSKTPLNGKASMEAAFADAYRAQLPWGQSKPAARTAAIHRLRSLIVEHRVELAASIQSPSRQDYRETITSELLPLADAAKWLTRKAKRVLAPRYVDGGGTPWWLGRIRTTVHRAPLGLVLVIGTWNYPLFLPGVQILQALAAGNAVVFKPAPGCERAASLFVELLVKAGIPSELVVLIDSSIDAAKCAIELGVDKVVMTGSSRSGRTVLHQLAETLTPAVMELSGCDAVYVLPGADLHRVCDLLLFGLRLNGGATCMAPRRVFVPKKISEVFHRLLKQRLEQPEQQRWVTKLTKSTYRQLHEGIEDALANGAQWVSHESDCQSSASFHEQPEGLVECGHRVLTNVSTKMKLCGADIFAPLLMILQVDDWSDALRADSQCPYALTASVFGPLEDALRIVKFISAGVITINDLIVPTADPQLPFGGRGESGFGTTRGNEGLLEMTCPKVVSVRMGKWLPHAKRPEPTDEALLDGLLQCSHAGSWKGKWLGLVRTVQAAMSQRKKQQNSVAEVRSQPTDPSDA